MSEPRHSDASDSSGDPPKRNPPGFYYTAEMRERALERIRKKREKENTALLWDSYIRVLFRAELRRLARRDPQLAATLHSLIPDEETRS